MELLRKFSLILLSGSDKKGEEDEDDEDDAIQEAIGEFGPWQILICLAAAGMRIPSAWFQLSIIYLAPPQDYWCAKPVEFVNITDEVWRNLSRPKVTGHGGSCVMYNTSFDDSFGHIITNASAADCTIWDYDTSIFTLTILQEWGLICSKKLLAYFVQTLFMLGMLVGGFLIGISADRYGRKKPLLFCIFCQLCAGIGTAFSSNFILFIALRFIVAACTGGTIVTGFVLAMEVVGKKKRSLSSVIFQVGFVVGSTSMSGLAYYFRNWRHFQLAISIPNALLISYFWLLPESPRWLLMQGRVKEATIIMKSAAKLNGLPVSQVDIALSLQKEVKRGDVKRGTFVDLFRYKSTRKRSLLISITWCALGICYYGLAQHMGQIGGNIFLNVTLAGIIQLPPALLAQFIVQKIGRKRTVWVAQIFAGIVCVSMAVVPNGENYPTWPKVALSALGIFGMGLLTPILFLYTGELLPTAVRNVGVGFCSMCLRVGSMCAPIVLGLDTFGEFIPPLVFGAIPILGALLVMLLPETANTNLTNTIQELEERRKSKKIARKLNGEVNPSYITREDFEQIPL